MRKTTLIDRLESAAVGSAFLDMEVVIAVNWKPDWVKDLPIYLRRSKDGQFDVAVRTVGLRSSMGHPSIGGIPMFTRSIDTARWLIQKDWGWRLDLAAPTDARDALPAYANVEGFKANAATPALALVAATLKALQAVSGDAA